MILKTGKKFKKINKYRKVEEKTKISNGNHKSIGRKIHAYKWIKSLR